MSDNTTNRDDSNETPGASSWLGVAAVFATAVAGLALGKKILASTADDTTASSSDGDGWGNWRSKRYAGGYCTYHHCRTTHADGNEFWCPHCWNQCMNMHYSFRSW